MSRDREDSGAKQRGKFSERPRNSPLTERSDRAEDTALPSGSISQQRRYILIHQAAKKYFDSLGADQPLFVKALREEYAKLLARKRKAYAEYKAAREEMKELYNVKSNVEHLLNIDEREIERDREQARR